MVERHGQLRVEGSRLVSASGETVQLRGLALHGLQWFPISKGRTIPGAVEFFNAQIIRPAMYIDDVSPHDPTDWLGGYLADPEHITRLERTAIEDAVDAGVYVLIDWHIHADPSHYTEEAVAFFSEQARHHGHLPNVIYEICNEPAGVGWSEVIKPYAEQVIAAIREHDPDNIILVGTPGLSRNIDEAIADPLPPELGSVMYALHYYTGEQDLTTMQEKAAAAQDAGMAVFVSSWKASSYDMNPVDYARAEQWAAFMEERDISWVYWGLNNKDEPASLLKPTASMAGPWDEDDLTENGQWWYQRLRPRP